VFSASRYPKDSSRYAKDSAMLLISPRRFASCTSRWTMKQVSEAGGAIAHLPPQEQGAALVACAAADKPRMRILMVAARYYPYMGGVETHTHEVARQLVARGQSVTVLSTDPSGRHAAEESFDGIEVLRVRPWSKKDDYYFAPAIAGKIASGAWDIVHVQGYHTFVAPLAMAAAVRRGLPFVITFHSGGHSSRLRNSLRRIQHGLLRPLIRRAEQIIAVSDFEANFFSSRLHIPRERFAVIQNGARLPEPGPGCSRESALLIVSIGRLERYKGHHRAILAFSELAQHMPKARL